MGARNLSLVAGGVSMPWYIAGRGPGPRDRPDDPARAGRAAQLAAGALVMLAIAGSRARAMG
jgi:uncharacterized membrane protein SpoIIM required for sporulation